MKTYYAIFFCLAITLHNLEEALWLPQWSQSGSSLQKPVTPNEFHFAVLIINGLAYLVSFLFLRFPKSEILKWAYIGFLGSMIIMLFSPSNRYHFNENIRSRTCNSFISKCTY